MGNSTCQRCGPAQQPAAACHQAWHPARTIMGWFQVERNKSQVKSNLTCSLLRACSAASRLCTSSSLASRAAMEAASRSAAEAAASRRLRKSPAAVPASERAPASWPLRLSASCRAAAASVCVTQQTKHCSGCLSAWQQLQCFAIDHQCLKSLHKLPCNKAVDIAAPQPQTAGTAVLWPPASSSARRPRGQQRCALQM